MKKYKIKLKKIMELIKEPLLAVLAALMISSFVISHTKVPTGSMIPTINPGDHLIVSRVPYYYRDPVRGEIVVFKYEGENLIKRVVAVPGDVIDIQSNEVYINGVALDESSYIESLDSTYKFSGSDIIFPYKVPENYYFMMGDNRKKSKDSRYFGPIARETIFAKAGLRIYPVNKIGIIR